eukprot:jgi/Tetstr1/446316/TSEL_033859.t1
MSRQRPGGTSRGALGDLVDKGKALDEAARSATASTAKTAQWVGHRPRLEDIRIVTRPPEALAAGDTAVAKKLPATTRNVIVRVYCAARGCRPGRAGEGTDGPNRPSDEAELWTHMALGMLPAYDEGPDSLDDYDHSYALGHAAQERWHRYVSEETDDVIIRLPTGVLLYHFQLRGM